MLTDKALETFPGWKDIINNLSSAAEFLNLNVDIERNNGMLKAEFQVDNSNAVLYTITSALSYKAERDSAKTCEQCGKWGNRHKMLPVVMCLCSACLAFVYSEQVDEIRATQGGESKTFSEREE